MAGRGRAKDGKYTGEIGLTESIAPISVRYPAEVDAVLRALPDRQSRIRQWVEEGLRREGLLK